MENKVTLFLMTEKGLEVLKGILDHFGCNVIDRVISSRDINVVNDFYEEIRIVCFKNNILFLDRSEAQTVKTDYAMAISWRWLIHLTSQKLVVFHDSILPAYRGFAPLVNALIKGEREIGVSAIFSVNEYDKGPIISQRKIHISYPVKVKEAIRRVSALYIELAIEVISSISKGETLDAEPQLEEYASYSLWLNDEDYMIDWSNDADYIKRFIDSVGYPYKGASTFDGERLFRIFESEVYPDVRIVNRHPGKIIFLPHGFPVVVCGKGLLKITSIEDSAGELQLPFKKFRTKFIYEHPFQ